MSILFLANKYTNVGLSIQKINSQLYFGNIQRGNMTVSCYITDPDGIFAGLGLKVSYTGRHELPDRECADNEIEILHFTHPEHGGHFVAGDGKGNVAYDPWGVSKCATEGRLDSKRIFQLM